MTKLIAIDAGTMLLDGGAMFGVVPKVLWERLNPADEKNMCTWALRCLLIDTGSRRILIDTGIGDKQDAKFLSLYTTTPHVLKENLESAGYAPSDITDVLLTHLHFDHCGGALERNAKGEIVPALPNAMYWTCQSHYNWALNPNDRERASFLKENIFPLSEHGVLSFIPEEQDVEWIEGITILFSYGHTEAMMIPRIPFGSKRVVYCADLLPSSFHVGMPYVMSYDIRPLVTLEEKASFFTDSVERGDILFLEHDPQTECITLHRDERTGKVAVGDRISITNLKP